MKKHKAAEHANHERWLVSYADFITLLFAFFVVMFATAQHDKSKAKIVAEAIRDAMEHGELSNVWTNFKKPKNASDRKVDSPVPPAGKYAAVAAEKKEPPKKAVIATHADLAKAVESLNQGLAMELKTGKVTVNLSQRGLVVSLREAAFFASGDDTVSATSFSIIEKISQVIAPLGNPLRLEGHTDSIPIHNSRFRNNWELSAARSIAMLELLQQQFHYDSQRLSVAGYADNAPVDTNDTEQGRAHNRRVDVVVLSAEALNGEPHASSAAGETGNPNPLPPPVKGSPFPPSPVPASPLAAPKK
jgi:chemotaxis protein MotB